MTLLNTALPFALIGWAQQRVDSGLPAVLTAGTMPLFTVVLAQVWLEDEKVTAPLRWPRP